MFGPPRYAGICYPNDNFHSQRRNRCVPTSWIHSTLTSHRVLWSTLLLAGDAYQMEIVLVVVFCHNVGARMNIVFFVWVAILFLMKCTSPLPSIMVTMKLETVNKFWACSPIFFLNMCNLCLFLDPQLDHTLLKCRCPSKILVTKLDMLNYKVCVW